MGNEKSQERGNEYKTKPEVRRWMRRNRKCAINAPKPLEVANVANPYALREENQS